MHVSCNHYLIKKVSKMNKKSSYQTLNEKHNITRLYNAELEHLIMRMGTNEQNTQFDKLRSKYVKMIENLKLNRI